MAQNKEEEFMKKHFKQFYENTKIPSVPNPETREFGYGVFRRKIANRNMSFSSDEKMNLFLREQVPLFLSYSNAYYKYPDRRPMNTKELLRADIIYEFDADDLPTSCKERHDSWKCSKGHEGNGGPELCPECGSSVEVKQWFCEECLEAAKHQTFRLLEFLEKDFAITKGISVNFSGKAGYHIHLRDESIQNLSKRARIELVDYLTGSGIFFGNLGYNLGAKRHSAPTGKGLWPKRINQGIKNYFEGDPKKVSAITGTPLKKVKDLFSIKDDLLKALDKGIIYPLQGRKSKEFWENLMYDIVEGERLPIDRQTSVDLHKIIRVPETLHGETGFQAKTIPIDKLKSFNPFVDAVVFGDEKVKLKVKETPEFEIKGQKFGPFNESEEELPLYCAIYLVGKGAAELCT